MAKPGAKLLTICTLAVGAIYAAGYVYTEPSAQAAGTSSVAGSSSPSHAATPGSSSPTSSSHRSSTTQSSSQYKDGVYTGSSSNAYGTLSVSVKVSQGKIGSVQITSYNMHYPSSYIDPAMVNEVISKQTWKVYAVSGATASSDNFGEAVYYALKKAKA